MGLSVVGILGTEDEVTELKFISKVFIVALRIHELVEEQKEKDK